MGLLDFGNVEKLLSRFDPLEFFPDQCSKERDRLSSCQECVRICPRWAIKFAPALQVDLSACDGCGLCATVCPNGVFEVKEDPDNVLLNRIGKMASEGNPTVIFVCRKALQSPQARVYVQPSTGQSIETGETETAETGTAETTGTAEIGEAAEPAMPSAKVAEHPATEIAAEEKVAEEEGAEEEAWQPPELRPGSFVLPSLGRLNEAVLVGSFAQGANLVWLDESPCEDCGCEQCREVTRRNVDLAKRLLEIFGSKGRMILAPEFPETEQAAIRAEAKRAAERAADVSRRQFLSAFRMGAMAAGAVLVEGAISQIAGEEEKSAFAYHIPTKRKLLLKLLRKLGKPEMGSVPLGDLPFAELTVASNCNLCGNCARFCPTSSLALRGHRETVKKEVPEAAEGSGPPPDVEFGAQASAPTTDGPAEPAASVASLDFSVPNCTRCALCLEICPFDSLSFKETIDPRLLLTDKPSRLIALEARKCVECGMEFSSSNPSVKRCVYCEMRRSKLGDDSWS